MPASFIDNTLKGESQMKNDDIKTVLAVINTVLSIAILAAVIIK